jgi:hypothetical protein
MRVCRRPGTVLRLPKHHAVYDIDAREALPRRVLAPIAAANWIRRRGAEVGRMRPERAMLLALSMDAEPVSALAAKAGLAEHDAVGALQGLQQKHLAIAGDGGYELTGPLSWFGDFASAVRHYARRNFVVSAEGEPASHLYVCDVRVKNARPVGDPLTETASVFACGTTARAVTPSGDRVPTCGDCRDAALSS